MQTSDVSAELRSSSPSVELLSESLSLLRKEEADTLVFCLDLSQLRMLILFKKKNYLKHNLLTCQFHSE